MADLKKVMQDANAKVQELRQNTPEAKVANWMKEQANKIQSSTVQYKDSKNKVKDFGTNTVKNAGSLMLNTGAMFVDPQGFVDDLSQAGKNFVDYGKRKIEQYKQNPEDIKKDIAKIPDKTGDYIYTHGADVALIGSGVAGGAKGVTNVMNKGSIAKGGVKAPTTQVQNASGLNIKTNPNAVKVYNYETKKLPIAGEYDLTSIEGMKNIQDKGLRDLLTQGDIEVQDYYHASPNPNIDVLDPSVNKRSLYGKGTYLANRSSEAVDQGMGNTLYTVETPHNQYLMDYYTSVGKQGGIPKYLADKLGLPENTVGGELYDALVERLGSKEAASKLLDDMGVKGHVVRFSDGNKYKVLYDKDSARIIDKYTRGQ